jgi:hypothetical protein
VCVQKPEGCHVDRVDRCADENEADDDAVEAGEGAEAGS